jgi:hypothetical protein
MSNLEIDLTSLISEQESRENNKKSLSNINNEQLKAKELLNNYNSEPYKKYLILLEKYLNEMKSKKYNQKYKFFVDENSNFVKEAIDSSDAKNNMIINVPKYININEKLNELETQIKQNETKLRFLRSSLLGGNKSKSEDFDKVKNELIQQVKDKYILIEVTKINNGDMISSEDEIDEIINKRVKQNETYTSISALIKENKYDGNIQFLIKKYIQNNIDIVKYQEKLRLLKDKEVSLHIIEKLPINGKKQIKFKTKKEPKKDKKKAGEENIMIIPELETHTKFDKINLIESIEADEAVAEVAAASEAVAAEAADEVVVDEAAAEAAAAASEVADEASEAVVAEVADEASEAVAAEVAVVAEAEPDFLNEINILSSNDESGNSEINLLSNLETPKNLFSNESLLPGEELEISELKLPEYIEDLEPIFEDDTEDDTENVESYQFNSPQTIQKNTEELKQDKNIPLMFEDNYNNGLITPDIPELDINKLSKDLNKKVSTDKVKIIKINPNYTLSNVKK